MPLIAGAVLSAPVALFVVPWPDLSTAIILPGAIVVHFAYKVTIALACERAAYPVVRGTGPLVTVIAASLFFAEHFTPVQWIGAACLSGGILLLVMRNIADEVLDRRALKLGLVWALVGGILVAVYTTYDAYGIRQSPDPFTFLAWFFFVTALDFPLLAAWRYRSMATPPVLRETSIIFAALIGWFILGEKVGPRRLMLMVLVALGAIIVETGG